MLFNKQELDIIIVGLESLIENIKKICDEQKKMGFSGLFLEKGMKEIDSLKSKVELICEHEKEHAKQESSLIWGVAKDIALNENIVKEIRIISQVDC